MFVLPNKHPPELIREMVTVAHRVDLPTDVLGMTGHEVVTDTLLADADADGLRKEVVRRMWRRQGPEPAEEHAEEMM